MLFLGSRVSSAFDIFDGSRVSFVLSKLFQACKDSLLQMENGLLARSHCKSFLLSLEETFGST